MHFHLESLVLNDLVAEVAGMAEKFSDRFVMVKASTEIEAMADRDRLKQVLINLVDNAVKYSPPGGELCVKLEQLGDGSYRLVIGDSGPGIPVADRENVFRRFFRLESSRSKQHGNGLGLSLVQAIAGMHRIKIVLRDNRPGLRVDLLLP